MATFSNLIGLNGNPICNQIIITTNTNGIYFQSYDSVVCKVKNGVTLSKHWNYSNTTRKYLYHFLRANNYDINSKKDVENAIKNGSFKVENTTSLSVEL